ncbi:MAG: TOBE domain-containing protein [Rhodoferax sp.]|nr:TOBE domain-containing protein [Rhodoferax sp.]
MGSANIFEGALARQLCGQAQAFAVRQEHLLATSPTNPAAAGQHQLQGELLAMQFLGASQRLEVRVGNQLFTALQPDTGSDAAPDTGWQIGQPVCLRWAAQHMVMLDA